MKESPTPRAEQERWDAHIADIGKDSKRAEDLIKQLQEVRAREGPPEEQAAIIDEYTKVVEGTIKKIREFRPSSESSE